MRIIIFSSSVCWSDVHVYSPWNGVYNVIQIDLYMYMAMFKNKMPANTPDAIIK